MSTTIKSYACTEQRQVSSSGEFTAYWLSAAAAAAAADIPESGPQQDWDSHPSRSTACQAYCSAARLRPTARALPTQDSLDAPCQKRAVLLL